MPFRYQRKKGLGTHRFRAGGAKIVAKAGDIVFCDPSELMDNINQYDCLDEEGKVQAVAKPDARIPELVPADQKNLFNIVNPDYPDRPLNDKPLRKKAALEFLESLGLVVDGSGDSQETGDDPGAGE